MSLAPSPSPSRSDRSWALLGLLVVFAFTLQGARSLWEPDEGRYVDVALQMLRSGDWFTPRLNPETVHLTKPPVTYWALAAAFRTFGVSEWAARLPNTLAFVATVLLVAALGRRLVPERPRLAAAIYATMLLPFVAANVVTTDTVLTLWETLAVFGFVAARWDRDGASKWWIVTWIGFGLAFLTKGPPGLLPLLAIVAFLLWRREWVRISPLAAVPGLVVFGLIAFGWFGLQVAARPDLLGYLLGSEVEGRLAGAYDRNAGLVGALRAYGPAVVAGLLPWNLVWLATWRRRRQAGSGPRGWRTPEDQLLLAWIVLPFAVFALAQSRLVLYVLPLVVPTSLLLARRLAPVLRRDSRRFRLGLATWALFLVGLKAAVSFWPHESKDGRLLAAQIREAVGEPAAEVVFVDKWPWWSTAFYLGAVVEAARLEVDLEDRGGPAYRPLSETLAHELEEEDQRLVFVVRRESYPGFQETLLREGWIGEPRGEVRGSWIVEARPDRPATGRVSEASASGAAPAI